MPDDRRQSTRFALSIPVGIHFPSGETREGWGRILDISASGLRLRTRFAMKMAGVVYLTFSLAHGGHFDNLRSRIMRVSYKDGYYEVGAAFDEVVDNNTLREILAALSKEGEIIAI